MTQSHTYPEIFKIPKHALTIKGWSRGSQNTGFFIPELKLLLDTQSSITFDPEFILITHNHADHCFSLPMKLTCINSHPVITVPRETIHFIVDFVNSAFRMNHCDMSSKCEHKIIGVVGGDIIPIKNNIFAKIYDLEHYIPCRGYGLNITKTKLKQEYIGLDKNEIVKLKHDGAVLTEPHVEPILAYLTDTTTNIFTKYPELLTYPYIMTECTFLPIDNDKTDKEIQLANSAKHTHWNYLYPIIKSHPEIIFVLIHFSYRYTNDELIHFRDTITDKNIIFAI